MTIEAAARDNIVLSIGNLVISAVASIAMARLLSPAAYADYATILALLTWSLLLGEGGGGVGFSRFLGAAAECRARLSLYRMFIGIRLSVGLAITAILAVGGPWWVGATHLSAAEWSMPSFAVVGGLVAFTLLGQIGYFALINSFRHATALRIAQLASIGKAIGLIVVAWWWPTPLALALVLFAATLVTALLYHQRATSLWDRENAKIPAALRTASLRHGLASIFDKTASGIGGSAFLLIVLAGIYQRSELAMLALATDFLQRALSVANLPVSNMVMPYIHRHEGSEYFQSAVRHVCALTLLIFLPVLGAVVVFLPRGLTLLFGEPYAQATKIALIAVVPLFAGAWSRMTFGFALIARRHYLSIFRLNAAQALASMVLLLLTFQHGLIAVVAGQGVVQLAVVTVLLMLAAQHGLVDVAAVPRRLLPCVAVATMIGLAVQYAIAAPGVHPAASVALGLGAFALALLAGLRFFVVIEPAVASILRRLIGARHSRWAAVIFPALAGGTTDHA